jgi:hypothetical protein
MTSGDCAVAWLADISTYDESTLLSNHKLLLGTPHVKFPLNLHQHEKD